MDPNTSRVIWILVLFAAYILIFFAAVLGLAIWKVRRHGNRPPVEFRFLRGPGETLRRRIARFDEEFIPRALLASLAPPFAAVAVIPIALRLKPQSALQLGISLGLIGAVFLGSTIAAIRWGLRSMIRHHNDRLGYLGERYVADCLEPLKSLGWHVFHDVPAEVATLNFNLDHVAVGPGGVWVIETKTRRKGRVRPGFDPQKVRFDGEKLIWPWGEDPYGPEQAKRNAEWLRKWILQRTGLEIHVYAVLALPGWFVTKPLESDVRVVRPEWLLEDLPCSRTALKADQIDLIARQMDISCRDVED